MKVLVCDIETRSALSALRALSDAGVSVIGASHKKHAMGFYSRACAEKLRYANPAVNPEVFLETLRVYLSTQSEPVCIMSFTDITQDVLMKARIKGMHKNAVIVGPPYKSYERATDKGALGDCAQSLGIHTPPMYTKLDIESDRVTYPLIIKPVRTVSWGSTTYKDTARIVRTKAEALANFALFAKRSGHDPLVQKMLTGSEYGIGVFACKGVVHTLFAYRRLRSITVHGGVSALRESIPLTEEMRVLGEKLVATLEWEGVMMIELKEDVEEGKLALIEINARFWGSLFLAVVSGVNFPYLLFLRASEKEIPPGVPYRVGVRARNLLGDISHMYALRKRAFTFTNLRAFFTFFEKDLHYDVLSLHDPLPGIIEFMTFIRKKL